MRDVRGQRAALLLGGLLVTLVLAAAAGGLLWHAAGAGADAPASDAPAAVVGVRFRTIDGDTGRPLAGVVVRCRIAAMAGSRTVTARSDQAGLLTLRTPPDASLRLEPVSPAGYEAFSKDVTVGEALAAAYGGRCGAGAAAGLKAAAPAGAAPPAAGTPSADQTATAASGADHPSAGTALPAGSETPAAAEASAVAGTAVADQTPADADIVEAGSAAGTEPATGAAAALLPLYRSSDQWPAWGRSADRRRVGPAVGLPSDHPLWTRTLKYNLEYPPVLAYGLAVVGSYSGCLYGLRQSDGTLVWRHQPGDQRGWGKFANQVAVSSWKEGHGDAARRVARVFYANLNGVAGAVDLFTGDPVWRRVSGRAPGTGGRTLVFRSFEASPLVVGETVYLATRYHRRDSEAGLWALDRRTGLPRWFCRLGTSARSKIGASPAYSRGRIFLASYDGSVFAVDAAAGRLLWRTAIGGEFYSTPTVVGGRVYIGNKTDGSLYCLNATDGRIVWSSVLGSSVYSSPAVAGGRVFAGTSCDFVALSAASGAVLWRVPTAKIFGSPSVLGSTVYFSDLGTTYGCDTRTGAVVWKWNAGRYSPVTATRALIVVCARRQLYAFRPSD